MSEILLLKPAGGLDVECSVCSWIGKLSQLERLVCPIDEGIVLSYIGCPICHSNEVQLKGGAEEVEG